MFQVVLCFARAAAFITLSDLDTLDRTSGSILKIRHHLAGKKVDSTAFYFLKTCIMSCA